MYLLIDTGNTQVKYMQSHLGEMGLIERTSNERFLQLLPRFENVQQILVASVANDTFADSICQWAKDNNIVCQHLVTQAESFAIKNSYANYHTMGIDRWLAVIGAEQLYPNRNLIVIDSGTATTIDVLSADKQHQGGWIVPGIDLMANSLFSNTDKVFGEVSAIEKLEFGSSTPDNVNMGVWAINIGLVNQAISLCKQQQLDDVILVFTGGYGDSLKKAGKFNGETVENLVFQGIARFIDGS
ncbi:type III pantothenate kinase [Thalassotalea sp. Y01]|uniref:type III pantothenate kinase n=1 Tax=Thalassotalea sp. Y01 TaxID=2729613 RepID=UPI00145FAE27|nr:type III pantothenate kinase [Thalassotalea sp. Y01]NMP15989.1 type III pantothenate kinase [Thalassotalea sp. Y01]